MNKESKIYVLGSGFVGTNVHNQLIKRGYKNTELLGRARVDLSDKVEVDFLFDNNKIDYVILSGALVGGIQANMINQYNFLLQNLLIQNNVIPNCVKHNIKSVILGSSCIYPKGYDILIEEDLLTAPLEPTNEGYSLAKIAGLKLAEYANREQDGKLISLMPCNIYGPKDNFDLNNSHVLSALVKKICDAKTNNSESVEIWGDGTQRREFLYIDELSDAIIWSLNNLDKTKTFLNVGTGVDISIKELAETIAKIVEYKNKFIFNTDKPNGMLKKCMNVNKINNLGWSSNTSFLDGLTETINYYQGLKK